MDASGVSTAEIAWTRALREAQAAASLEEGLAALLARLCPTTGALAAAAVEWEEPRIHGCWRCSEEEVARAVGTIVLQASGEDGAMPHRQLPLDRFRTSDGSRAASALIVPMGQRCGGRVWLLLIYATPERIAEEERERVAGIGALGTLLCERECFAEETRRARHARDHFLVAIHHELRTPATALMLESGLLQSGLLGALPPRLQHSLTRLDGQVNELVRVIRRVLDLASLETSVDPPRDDLVDPRETITALARHIEPAAERKGIVLSLFFPRTLPVVQTDAERFRRVLLYLLGNALKYTEKGRVQVRVERSARTLGPSRREPLLLVRVADTGCGIPADELERIFEPFAQVDEGARTDSSARGVGLGLPLARKLARSLGGDVLVESAPGQGTMATFLVPYRLTQGR
jgi:signal transduction histidine kinase